jgi:hypothetical protein
MASINFDINLEVFLRNSNHDPLPLDLTRPILMINGLSSGAFQFNQTGNLGYYSVKFSMPPVRINFLTCVPVKTATRVPFFIYRQVCIFKLILLSTEYDSFMLMTNGCRHCRILRPFTASYLWEILWGFGLEE